MPIALLPTLSYVLISTFTPGPANISSTSVAVLHGYKNALRFQLGLGVGVFLYMLSSGLISSTLLSIFPALEPVLRYVGAVYILYLAYSIARASYTFSAQNTKPLGFLQGVLLQVLNPKLFIYAFSVFTTFLAPLTGNIPLIVLAATVLAFISFVSTTVWSLFGSAIKTYLSNPRHRSIINILLALSLVYTAIALTGLL